MRQTCRVYRQLSIVRHLLSVGTYSTKDDHIRCRCRRKPFPRVCDVRSEHRHCVSDAMRVQGLQAAFWLWLPLLLAAARPQRTGFRRRAAILAGANHQRSN